MRRLFRLFSVLATLSVALPLVGLTGAGGTTRAATMLPTQLSAAEIATLAAGAGHHVIVLMKNQHTELAGRANTRVHSAAVRAEQAPLLKELSQVKAKRVKAFHLINALAATVTASEEDRLRANPAVQTVVADGVIRRPQLVGHEVLQGTGARTPAAASSTGAGCSSTTPSLEPEALQLTNTAFSSSSAPQAQKIVTGQGVKVAFMADGIDFNNPEFVRPDGSLVFLDYQDFSGDGPLAPTTGGEAFIDASSIAAQGMKTYDVNNFIAPGTNQHPSKCLIKIRGMAPGASLIGLKIFGQTSQTFLSAFIQAIQYAVDDGAEVLNESFGVFNQQQRNEIVSLADEQAVQDGVTVIASSGDSGAGNTVSAPSTDPSVISVGATTQFRAYAQGVLYGFQQSNGKWVSNNISALSSSGISPDGRRTVDVVAGGDLSWAPCTADLKFFSDCSAGDGVTASPIELSGGTSESGPLVAGEAALVIQAYRTTHHGANPTPQVVRQIIMGTAQDLHVPSSEQGAGLIDSLRAVQAAMAYAGAGRSTPTQDSSLLTWPTSLSSIGNPFSQETQRVQVTNNTSHAQWVYGAIRRLGQPFAKANYTPSLDEAKSPTFTDSFGITRTYTTQTFTVPGGADRLDANLSWNEAAHPHAAVRFTLLDPQGTYTAYSLPQNFPGVPVTSAYGHVDVRNPVGGVWTAVIWTLGRDPRGYSGAVHFDVASSRFEYAPSGMTILPLHLGPWQTGAMTVPLQTPTAPGDANEDLVLSGLHPGISGGLAVVPITLRSLVPLGSTGGAFGGTLTGSNGRPDTGPRQTFDFEVPAGLKDLDLGISLTDKNYNLEGFLTDPNGLPADTQSTVTGLDPTTGFPTSYTNTMQFFRRDPQPGRWRFTLAINDNISGAQTSLPFHGKIVFNGVRVTTHGLPNSIDNVIPAGQSVTAQISVTNTGNTTKDFFVDPRWSQSAPFEQTTPNNVLPIDLKQSAPVLLVPPETSQLDVVSESPAPIAMDAVNAQGTAPFDFTFNPDLQAVTYQDLVSGLWVASASMSAAEVPFGLWLASPQEIGPYSLAGAVPAPVATFAVCTMRQFDPFMTSSTGDPWSLAFNPKASNSDYTPVTLAPTHTGTISVTMSPPKDVPAGSIIHGFIYVETLKFPNGLTSFEVNDFGADELVAIPYTYSVG